MGRLNDFQHDLVSETTKEEISIILDQMEELTLSDLEYDFIMDIAEKPELTEKQVNWIARIYSHHIDSGE